MSDNGIPEKLKDDKGRVIVGLAASVSAVIVGGFVGVLTGYIPADGVASKEITVLFVGLAGAVVGFLFGKKA